MARILRAGLVMMTLGCAIVGVAHAQPQTQALVKPPSGAKIVEAKAASGRALDDGTIEYVLTLENQGKEVASRSLSIVKDPGLEPVIVTADTYPIPPGKRAEAGFRTPFAPCESRQFIAQVKGAPAKYRLKMAPKCGLQATVIPVPITSTPKGHVTVETPIKVTGGGTAMCTTPVTVSAMVNNEHALPIVANVRLNWFEKDRPVNAPPPPGPFASAQEPFLAQAKRELAITLPTSVLPGEYRIFVDANGNVPVSQKPTGIIVRRNCAPEVTFEQL